MALILTTSVKLMVAIVFIQEQGLNFVVGNKSWEKIKGRLHMRYEKEGKEVGFSALAFCVVDTTDS